MKKLYIYYSLTGNGELIANTLRYLNFDIRRIEPRNKLPKNKLLQILIGGYKAMKNKEDELLPYNKDISMYDEILIGSPIWNDRLSTPINKLLSELDLSNKKVSFLFYSGSGEASTAVNKVNELFDNPEVIVLKEPMKNKHELDKLEDRYE